jgi:hypothetical protein
LKDIIKYYKNLDKRAKKKKGDQSGIIIIIKKTQTIKDKIESHKNFDKRTNDKNKKLNVEGSN